MPISALQRPTDRSAQTHLQRVRGVDAGRHSTFTRPWSLSLPQSGWLRWSLSERARPPPVMLHIYNLSLFSLRSLSVLARLERAQHLQVTSK